MHGVAEALWQGFCLTWRGEAVVPGATPSPNDYDVKSEIYIEYSPAVSVAQPGPEQWFRRTDAVDYIAPSSAHFSCRKEGVTITPVVGADPVMIGRLLIANALPALLWLREGYALHAAAAVLPGQLRALAICGASGSGKSTVARQLIANGAALVADDVLAVDQHSEASGAPSGRVIGAGLPGGLWSPVGETRCFVAVPTTQQREAAEMAAVLILARGPADTAARFERISPVAAVEALLGQRHRPQVPALIGTRRTVLAQAARLAGQLPLWRWTRPEGAPALTSEEWSKLAELSQ